MVNKKLYVNVKVNKALEKLIYIRPNCVKFVFGSGKHYWTFDTIYMLVLKNKTSSIYPIQSAPRTSSSI